LGQAEPSSLTSELCEGRRPAWQREWRLARPAATLLSLDRVEETHLTSDKLPNTAHKLRAGVRIANAR
jgi:hypothetical protein